jgi:hypothetical protein
MRPEIAKRLALVYPGLSIPATGVVGVADASTGVADVACYARKPQEIRQLRPLRHEIDKGGKTGSEAVAAGVATTRDAEADAIEERAAIISETCPAPFFLNHQKPMTVSDAQWSRALDDAGRFLDDWVADAAAMKWSAGELFEVARGGRPGGLVWQLRGQKVGALGEDHARLSDGRTIDRQRNASPRKPR